MTIETLGEAWSARWRVKARCAHGKRDAMKSIRECFREYELDMETLVWTRGAAMPLSDLSGRLRCPACRSLKVSVAFVPPPVSDEGRAHFQSPREDLAALPHRVELYGPGGSLDKLIAASSDIDVARGAYEVAKRQMTLQDGFHLIVRRFGSVVARHPEEPAAGVVPAAPFNANYARMREGLPKGRKRRWK